MSNYDPDADESTDLEPRDARALAECMTVLPQGGDVFDVVGENGDTYAVDARDGRCTCPDHKHRDARCKHLRRVAYATGERPIPGWVDPDGVDELLGEQTDVTTRVAATDGGIIEAGDDGEILDDGDDGDGGRPEDCECGDWNAGEHVDLACWPCYRDGFKTPAPCEGDK